MPVTARYRISSNEVGKISAKGQTFSDRDTAVFSVLTDPTTPDGTDVRDMSGPEPGPLRVLGLAKWADVGGNTVRNATQAEIDTFAAAELDDSNQLDADQAVALFKDHKQWRKKDKAFADVLKDEINILRAQWQTFQDDVAAASDLGDLQAAVALYTTKSPRTLAQLETAIENRISKDD